MVIKTVAESASAIEKREMKGERESYEERGERVVKRKRET